MESIRNFIDEKAEFHNTKLLKDFCSLSSLFEKEYEYIQDKFREVQRIQQLMHIPHLAARKKDILNIYIPSSIKRYYETLDELVLLYKQIKIS